MSNLFSFFKTPALTAVLVVTILCSSTAAFAQPLRVGIVGLNHDHVHGIMHQFKKGEVVILGIAEANPQLVARFKKTYQLPDSLFYSSLTSMLNRIHPDAVLAYNPIASHIDVVEACAPRGISVMVEKPLATTVAQSERMAALAMKYHTLVLTNYETTWYSSNQRLYQLAVADSFGPITKMIVHMGHQGPKEINCSADFLAWLTDPEKNGGGAVMDFGCYGANLMTWLQHNRAPVAVTAITRHLKPALYPKVDDDATILLEYADGSTGIVEASWSWSFGIKDWEVFGQKTYLHALNGTMLQRRDRDSANYYNVPVPTTAYTDNLVYLADVLRAKIKADDDLSSLSNNLIVVKILDAARRSAKEGRRIAL